MQRTEAVLGSVWREGEVQAGESEALQHLGSWAEEGNWPIASALVGRFTWLRNRQDERLLPDVWNLGSRDGEVENVGQELNAGGPKFIQVKNCETVRSGCGGVFTLVDDSGGIYGGERGVGVVQVVGAFYPSKGMAQFRVAGVCGDACELLVEIFGYRGGFGAGFGGAVI